MKQANPLRNLFTPPPSRDYDERLQYIHLLVARDAFIALLACVFLLPLILQLPMFTALRSPGLVASTLSNNPSAPDHFPIIAKASHK